MASDPFHLSPEAEASILREASARRAQYAQARASVTPYMVERAQQIVGQWPNASAGTVQESVRHGLTDEQVAAIAGQDDGGGQGLVGSVASFLSDGVETIYEQAIKPTLRVAFTAAEGLAQELVQRPLTAASASAFGDAPSFRQAYDQYGDSAALNIIQGDYGAPIEGEGRLGHGIVPGGQAVAESERERTLTIGGQRATFGRALPTSRMVGALAGHDSTAYNVVSGVSQFAGDVLLDPLALVSGGSTTAARAAARLGASAKTTDVIAGGVQGLAQAAKQLDAAEASTLLRNLAGAVEGGGRRSAIIEDVEQFFGNRALLSKLAESSAYDIFQSFKRSPANHIDTGLMARLGAATDETAVSEILLDAVQRGKVTERGFYSGLTTARRTVRDSRLSGVSPRGKVSVDDLDDAADKLDSFLRQAKVDRDTRAGIFERVIAINDPATPWAERTDRFFDVVTDSMAEAGGSLHGDLESIRKAVRLTGTDVEVARKYGVDVAGDPILFPHLKRKVDPGTGQEVITPTPQITSELLQEGFHLPDVTAVRRAAQRATRMERLYTSKGWEVGADAARWVTRDLFKPLAILRPAYVVRIGVEEQFRLAAAGFDSIFTHPLRFIQANILAKSADTSLTGDNWEAVADGLNAINRRAYDVRADGRHGDNVAALWADIRKGDEPTSDFLEAWRRELGQLSAAREVRQLAKDGNLGNFVKWARETADGRAHLERIARVNPDANDLLTNDRSLIEWGESIKQRIAAKAGGEVSGGVTRAMGDPDILDGIASGRFAAQTASTDAAVLTNMLRGKFDRAPGMLKVDAAILDGGRQGRLDKAVDWMFDTLTGKPTNSWARYPAFRQAYIRNATRSFDALKNDATRRDFARGLDEMFTLTKAEKAEVATALKRHAGKVGFWDDLTELDEIVKLRSASEVKDLLFDVTRRSNIQDSYEVALPFFDAWAEVTKTWARLARENPAFMIRAEAGLQSAREQGTIFTNDHGEEVFAYPGGGLLSRFFPGDDTVTLEGRLQGANLVAQGVGPGFGPIVQWGTGALLPKGEQFQEVREWLAPFGTGGIESAGDLSNPGAILEALTPAWMRKVVNATTGGKLDPVQFHSMAGDVAKVLANSGAYDPSNPTDQQRMIADAGRGARFLLFLRGLTQGVAITGPSAVWRVKTDGDEGETIPDGWDPEADPDGTFHVLGTLANEYRRLRDHYNYDDELAAAAFIDLYGVEPFYIGQAKTRSISNLPVDEQGFGWVRRHGDAAKEYASTIGYFVPPNEDAELDYAIYRDQLEAGDRQSLTAEQQVQLANRAKAYSILGNVRRRVEGQPTAVREKVMAHTRAVLEGEFPGWSAPVLGVGDTLNSEQRIEELSRAAFDPRLSDSPVAGSLQTYMRARQVMLAEAQARGVQTLGAQASADLADRLEQVGLYLASTDQAFAGVWLQLLAREVVEEQA